MNEHDILDRLAVADYVSHLTGPQLPTLRTGLPSWDRACDETGGEGLAGWWYVVIGGASNAGKTQLMLHLVVAAAMQGLRPGVITMEVPRTGIQRSLYARMTPDFGYYDFLPGKWQQRNPLEAATKLMDSVDEWRMPDKAKPFDARQVLVYEHERAPMLKDIIEAVGQLVEAGSRVVFLDHLQLIKSGAHEIAERATEVSEELRWFAHKQKILVIALSQLNRQASRERERQPISQDCFGGTSIEANANQVLLLDHSFQDRDVQYPHLLRTQLVLDKNRHGPARVTIPVEANFRTGEWREPGDHELDHWPSN